MRLRQLSPFFVLFGILCLAFVVQGCSPPPLCGVTDYIVTKPDDTNDGVCDADCSLREAIINANACPGHQTIHLPADGYTLTLVGSGEDLAATGDLDITDDVTIIGTGAPSVHGFHSDRVFEIFSPAVVVMDHIMVIDGEEQLGAGILNHGTLTLYGLSIHDNMAVVPPGGGGASAGGGIFNETGILTMYDTQVFSNVADHGAGIHNFATATLEATNLTLAGNVANGHGGGLWNNMAATAVLDDATIRLNDSTETGAGIYNSGDLEINLATFEENVSVMDGGGLFTTPNGTSILYDVWFTNNNGRHGGAVYNQGMTHLYRTGINNNSAMGAGGTGGLGGGAYNDVDALLFLRNVTISSNMIVPPHTDGGSGIYNAGNLVLEFATVAQNNADGIHNISAGEYTIRSSIIAYHAEGNCTGPIAPSSNGYNVENENSCGFIESSDLVDTNPLLAPLGLNGGNSLTHLLSPGSPAIDSGDPDKCTAQDQRGVSRPQGAGCDRGAVEMEGITPTPVPTEVPTPTPTPAPIPASINFNADRYLLEEGECTKLHWQVENADEVFLDGEPVDALGARQVCPEQTTTYVLLVLSPGGEEEAYVTIEVEILPEPPDAPAQLHVADWICDPKLYQVTLAWIDMANNESGYKVYRDGVLLATLPANSTNFVDEPPFGGPYTYEVVAFNEGGASPKASVIVKSCER
ncbi:MAG: choice-of-anchor Q domain-containing protein [Anaerolineales bacterium]